MTVEEILERIETLKEAIEHFPNNALVPLWKKELNYWKDYYI